MNIKLLAILSSLASIAAADCDQNTLTRCNWHGSSPDCGNDGRAVGYTDGTWTLTATTQYKDHTDLMEAHAISEDCYNDYGAGCWGGYKRLWFKRIMMFYAVG
ncbi:hypothetical protein N7456_007621 [Penicillium angulare]|uniref:Uncharacterized protein n=1 Tax=Penicillium angulare TaxID=116970 RepID=A0A9W9K8K1_9EURO|nr:hypothetical protein N7456_007621 [Penicillium angulare]